jgi:hypothetical protein
MIALLSIITLHLTASSYKLQPKHHAVPSKMSRNSLRSIELRCPRTHKPLLAGLGDLFCSITGVPPTSLYPSVGELLRGTSIDPARSNVNLVRCYKASIDGWSAIDFHRCVDGRGSCLVSALSNKSNRRFGGFNPLGWRSSDDYGSSNAAFLWFEGVGSSAAAIKVPVLPGGGACLFDYASSGPCFGASDLILGPSQAGKATDFRLVYTNKMFFQINECILFCFVSYSWRNTNYNNYVLQLLWVS